MKIQNRHVARRRLRRAQAQSRRIKLPDWLQVTIGPIVSIVPPTDEDRRQRRVNLVVEYHEYPAVPITLLRSERDYLDFLATA